MNRTELVSVIIPCYNQGAFLEECLSSVFASTYINVEVIIIDDGSTDQSKEIITALQSKFKFTVHHQQNSGPSVARNKAIQLAKGTYILPLDADDKIGNTYIEHAVEVLSNDQSIGIVYCLANLFGVKEGKWELPAFNLKLMLARNLIFNCGLFRLADFQRTQGYNENMLEGWEDWDFWLSLLELGVGVHRLEEVGFYYRIRVNSRDRSIDTAKIERLRKQIVLNHPQLYLTYFDNPIDQYHQLKELEEFRKSFHHLKNSKDYRLGRMLLLPLRKIMNLFKS